MRIKIKLLFIACVSVLSAHGIAIADVKKMPIEVSGLVEIEASSASPYVGSSVSDIVLATAELGLSGQVNDQISASITLLYEEDDTDLEVDVAKLTFKPADTSWSVTAGQIYVPFGSYDTNMVSDPLTLEIGEARETAIQFDFEMGHFSVAGYLFNGANKKNNGADDKIDNFGLNLGYAFEGKVNVTANVGYINDIGDSDGLEGSLTSTNVQDHVAGISLSLMAEMGDVNVIIEYVAARDSFLPGELAFAGGGAKPKAFNIEAGYSFKFLGKWASVGVGYQTTDESLALGLPEKRIISSFGVDVMKNTTVGIEFVRDSDYSVSEGGTGQSARTVTAQVAVEF